jgi:hypothetical protein
MIRVSFSALLRVKDDNRYVVFHTPSRPGSFGPPGGVFKYFEPAVGTLERLHFREERIRSRQDVMKWDLRGFLPARSIRAFQRWFASGAYREDAAECLRRELIEELDEVGFPHLASEVRGLALARVGAMVEGPFDVPGKGYRQLRRFEVHDLVATEGSATRLRQHLIELGTDPTVQTVLCPTAEEIVHGRSGSALIGPHAALLVRPRRVNPDLPGLL